MLNRFESDFYSHKFIISIDNEAENQGLTFLTIQQRRTKMQTELITTNFVGKYISFYPELLKEAYFDIDA